MHDSPISEAQPTDLDLMRQAASGDADAFACVYRRYGGDVLAFLARFRCGQRSEDMAQEVFLRLARGGCLPRGIGRPDVPAGYRSKCRPRGVRGLRRVGSGGTAARGDGGRVPMRLRRLQELGRGRGQRVPGPAAGQADAAGGATAPETAGGLRAGDRCPEARAAGRAAGRLYTGGPADAPAAGHRPVSCRVAGRGGAGGVRQGCSLWPPGVTNTVEAMPWTVNR